MMRAVLCFLPFLATAAGACPTAATPPRLSPPAAGEIISGFGPRTHPILQMLKFHIGVDYSATLGDPIRAAAAGVVTVAARKGEYGNYISINHGAGVETAYAHLRALGVKEGDCVEAGAVIGQAGSTGLVKGVQLHFEVRENGQNVDPAPLLKGQPR